MTDSASSILQGGEQGQSQGGQGSGNGSANSPWYGEVIGKDSDADFQSFVKNKNYPDVAAALKGHYNAEKLIGLDRAGRTVVLPKDDNDAEGWKAFRAKLGVPETADGYKLPFADGTSDTLAKAAATWFHKAGVPPKAAEDIAKEWNGFFEAEFKAAEDKRNADNTRELNALKMELGTEFEAKQELSRRAFRIFGKEAGIGEEQIEQIENVLGAAKTVKLFMAMGDVLREAEFAGGNDSGGHTPDALRAKLKEYQENRVAGKYGQSEWTNKILPEVIKIQDALDKL